MQEWKIAYVNKKKVPVLISDEKEALLAAKAAGRAIIGLWRPGQEMGDISAAKYVVENPEVRIRQCWKPVPTPVLDQTPENEPKLRVKVTFERVKDIVDEMKNEIANVLAQTEGQVSPTVAVIEFMGDSIWNYGASSLGGDMVTALGGTLAAPDASDLGKEDLVALDPDVIFVVYMAHTETVEAEKMALVMEDPAFADLSAVKNGRVKTIMLGDMYASTVRSIDGIRVLAAGMYPELVK